MINIIVLTKTDNKFILDVHYKFLNTLIKFTKSKFKLIIIENNSTDLFFKDVWQKYCTYHKEYIDIEFINLNNEPFNMNKFFNIGLNYINNNYKYLCFANSDLIFHQNWDQPLIDAFDKFNDIGYIMPSSSIETYQYLKLTNKRSNEYGPFRIGSPREEYLKIDSYKPIPGFIYFFNKDFFINYIEKWDENFKGWYQDDDIIKTCLNINRNIYISRLSTVDHLEGLTFKKIKDTKILYNLTKNMLYTFENKWQNT
jgi:hypothetical protein